MRYSIEQDNEGFQTLWVVKSGRKILSHHESKGDAERAVQRYIVEDRYAVIEGRS
jgi:ABC-type ATPase with predicted acetyltransferase domain